MSFTRHGGSFRDPAGFIFEHEGQVYRQVNQAGRADYDQSVKSGLFDELIKAKLLVEQTEIKNLAGLAPNADRYKLLRPQQIEFISYTYEWSFSQLKDAALTTLKAQAVALEHGMILKDASAYNVQFTAGRPILIDSLSFEANDNGPAWKGYKQFCQHFLAPLLLMSYVDLRLGSLSRDFIDGVPLDLAAALMPARSRLRPAVMMHLFMHSAAQNRYASSAANVKMPAASKSNIIKLKAQADSLRRLVSGLKIAGKQRSEWGEYYSFTNYSDRSLRAKEKLVGEYLSQLGATTVWDLGGNDGRFSRVALKAGAKRVICFDIDPLAVEKNYLQLKKKPTNLLPLLIDLTNPSPAIGWANQERQSLAERSKPKTTLLALALIHHLAISNNLPLERIAEYFASLGSDLIIEFVPKSDSKVQLLLASREDIFGDYDQAGFERAFQKFFQIKQQDRVPGSQRRLYLMKRKAA